jgi:uncharacterized protein DUF222
MFASVQRVREHLAQVVDELDPHVFDANGAVRMLDEFAAIERLAVAGKTLMAGRVEDSNAWRREGDRSAAHFVARRTRSTIGDAVGLLQTAERLSECAATEGALRAGEVSVAQAREITAAAVVDPSMEPELLDTAANDGLAVLRDRCRQVKAAACTDDVERYEQVRRARHFRNWTEGDTFRASIACNLDGGARLLAGMRPHIEAAFREAREQGRREPLEAYALDGLIRMAETSSSEPGSMPPAAIHVHVDHGAFTRGRAVAGETCEIPGVGPIPVATVRALADDAILYGIVTKGRDVTTIANLGRTIPARLRKALEARDPECVVPGCSVSERLEIHHRIPVADGGRTSLENTARYCRWHHYLETHHGYRLDGQPGDWQWRAPPDHAAA